MSRAVTQKPFSIIKMIDCVETMTIKNQTVAINANRDCDDDVEDLGFSSNGIVNGGNDALTVRGRLPQPRSLGQAEIPICSLSVSEFLEQNLQKCDRVGKHGS